MPRSSTTGGVSQPRLASWPSVSSTSPRSTSSTSGGRWVPSSWGPRPWRSGSGLRDWTGWRRGSSSIGACGRHRSSGRSCCRPRPKRVGRQGVPWRDSKPWRKPCRWPRSCRTCTSCRASCSALAAGLQKRWPPGRRLSRPRGAGAPRCPSCGPPDGCSRRTTGRHAHDEPTGSPRCGRVLDDLTDGGETAELVAIRDLLTAHR